MGGRRDPIDSADGQLPPLDPEPLDRRRGIDVAGAVARLDAERVRAGLDPLVGLRRGAPPELPLVELAAEPGAGLGARRTVHLEAFFPEAAGLHPAPLR